MRRVWPFALVAVLCAVVAALVALHVHVPQWVRPTEPDSAEARLHGAVLAVLLVVLARGLAGRRKTAYWAGMVAAVCGALTFGPGVPAVFLLVIGVLLALRPADFTAVPALSRVRTAVAGGLVVLAGGGLYDAARADA